MGGTISWRRNGCEAMRTCGNTILITGGSSGIGLELARQFKALENTVIVTGRNATTLAAAAKKLPGIEAIQSDVSDPAEIDRLRQKVLSEFPKLNVLVNNAGIMAKDQSHEERTTAQGYCRRNRYQSEWPDSHVRSSFCRTC